MKVAFLTTRREKPSYRFRIAHFIPYLRERGVECETFLIPSSPLKRWSLFVTLRGFDVAVIQKKMLRPLDRMIVRAVAGRIVYDVDDALMYSERGGRVLLSAARRRRFRAMMRMSDLVLAGNDYLCKWAANSAKRAVCFPTVVDTDHYTPSPRKGGGVPVIGWIGSSSTNRYLDGILPILEGVAKNNPFVLRVVSDSREGISLSRFPGLSAEFSQWDERRELEELGGLDIGLMPLPDNEWARGKCALKALLYMACGIPPVCSAIGAVTAIVNDGENGFLAVSDADWRRALQRLIDDVALRARMAERARETVVSRYSVAAAAPKLHRLLCEVTGVAEE